MKRFSVLLLVLLLAFCVGCSGSPKIDASTNETLKESMGLVRDSLEADQKEAFDKAIMIIFRAEMGNMFTMTTTPEAMMEKLKDRLDGKTGKQVIELAEEIREEKK